MSAEKTTQLFSLENLPSDPELLRKLRDNVDEALGEPRFMDLSVEVLDHFDVVKNLRDELIIDATSGAAGAASAAVSSINAFTSVLIKIAELREKSASQAAFQNLVTSVIDVLSEEDIELRKRVVAQWRRKQQELNS